MFLNKKTILVSLILLSCLLITTPALAQYGLEKTAETAGIPEGLQEATPASIIGQIIGIALGLVGVIFLVLMVYGGFLWMTARGNTKQVEDAKNLIISAVIGIIIVAGAYVVTNFVLEAITGVGSETGVDSGNRPNPFD